MRRIHELYLHGLDGKMMGMKAIGQYLTGRGHLLRGASWGMQDIHRILSSPVYIGEHYFNTRDSRTRRKRPMSEWVKTEVEPIIDRETFERVKAKRASRAPDKCTSRALSSPVLLTGLLKCGGCGSTMTLATGKSGRYRYYKCTFRHGKGNHACGSGNYPVEKLDRAVLEQLSERVFAPARLQKLVEQLRRQEKATKSQEQNAIQRLQKRLKEADTGLNRLYEGVAKGVLALDDTLQRNVQLLKAQRESILIELAGNRRRHALPLDRLLPSQVEAFGKALRKKLLEGEPSFAKSYLHALVDQIVVTGNEATVSGSYGKLASAIAGKKKGTAQVPSFMGDWRARRDSNS